MAPCREDSQDSARGQQWHHESSVVLTPPAESHSKEKSNRGVFLGPPGWGRGCCPAIRAPSLAGDIPSPCSAWGQCPCCCSRAAWGTLPWEQGPTAAALLLWSALTKSHHGCRVFTMQKFQWRAAHNHCTVPVQTSHIPVSCSTAGLLLCTNTLREQGMPCSDCSCAWLTEDQQDGGEGRQGRRGRAREMRFTSPRFLVHSSKGCHCEQQSCGCRCTLASCCKNCCGTSALQSVPWKKGSEKGAQSKEEKRRLVHFNQSRYPHKHSIKQLGADKPQSISSFFCFSLMLSVKG